jgi:hypothetical protein
MFKGDQRTVVEVKGRRRRRSRSASRDASVRPAGRSGMEERTNRVSVRSSRARTVSLGLKTSRYKQRIEYATKADLWYHC